MYVKKDENRTDETQALAAQRDGVRNVVLDPDLLEEETDDVT